jgi:hypothetical protein
MRRLLLGGLAMLLVACGGDSATGPAAVTGSYSLRTVNGGGLPAVVYQDASEKDEIVRSSIALAADNSWSGSLTIRGTDLTNGVVFPDLTLPIGGTYSLNSGTIKLTDADHQLTFDGTVGGGTLTVGSDIVVGSTTTMVFRK